MRALGGARLLLAEDNAINQLVACELLKDAGLTVDVADNGAIAVRMAQERAYDLVLMDMQMPEMDGLEATRALRRIDALAGLPIVAMTANAMQADQQRCSEAGMVDFISKPIEPDAMWQVLLRWLKPRAAKAAPLAAAQTAVDADAGTNADTNADTNIDADAGANIGMPTDTNADPATLAALSRLPGFDAAAGLRRLMGRHATYLLLLRRFVEGYRSGLAPVHAALAAGDFATAERFVHSLRGVAGNIGCIRLPALAHALEQALQAQAGAATLAPLLDALGQALQLQTAGLADALANAPPAPAPAPARAVDAEQGAALLGQLRTLLQDSDAEAGGFVQAHEATLRGLLNGHFGALRTAVDQYAFDDALALVAGTSSSPQIARAPAVD